MNTKSKCGLMIAGGLLLTLAACGGDDTPFSLGTAAGDGNVNAVESGALVRSTSETAEPDDVSQLSLATSETSEPFDLPD